MLLTRRARSCVTCWSRWARRTPPHRWPPPASRRADARARLAACTPGKCAHPARGAHASSPPLQVWDVQRLTLDEREAGAAPPLLRSFKLFAPKFAESPARALLHSRCLCSSHAESDHAGALLHRRRGRFLPAGVRGRPGVRAGLPPARRPWHAPCALTLRPVGTLTRAPLSRSSRAQHAHSAVGVRRLRRGGWVRVRVRTPRRQGTRRPSEPAGLRRHTIMCRLLRPGRPVATHGTIGCPGVWRASMLRAVRER